MTRRCGRAVAGRVGAAVLGLGAWVVGCDSISDGAGNTVALRREDLVVVARASGELRAVRSRDFAAPAGRSRVAYLVEDGSRVEPGMPLVAFDTQELVARIGERRSDLGAARAELDRSRLDADSERRGLEVEVARAEVELDRARAAAASDPGLTPSAEIRKARLELAALERVLAGKRKVLQLAPARHQRREEAIRARIRRAEVDLAAVEEQLRSMRAARLDPVEALRYE